MKSLSQCQLHESSQFPETQDQVTVLIQLGTGNKMDTYKTIWLDFTCFSRIHQSLQQSQKTEKNERKIHPAKENTLMVRTNWSTHKGCTEAEKKLMQLIWRTRYCHAKRKATKLRKALLDLKSNINPFFNSTFSYLTLQEPSLAKV